MKGLSHLVSCDPIRKLLTLGLVNAHEAQWIFGIGYHFLSKRFIKKPSMITGRIIGKNSDLLPEVKEPVLSLLS